MSATTAIAQTNIEILAACGRSAEELSVLVHQIYEAAAEPERWPQVVGAIADSLGAQKGLLFTPYARPQEGGFLFPWMIEEFHLQLWGSKYIEHDVWAKSIFDKQLNCEGVVLLDEQLISRDVLAQSVFFCEFLSTMNIGRVCTAMLLGGAPGLPITYLSVFRPFDAPAFSPAEVAWYQLLIPHLSRALGLQHRLDALRVQNQSLLSAFDRMDFGVCILNELGQILYVNSCATRVFERRDGLSLNADNCLSGLRSATPSIRSTESLATWIQRQIASNLLVTNPSTHFSDAFLQVRQETGKHYALQCSLLPTSLEGSRQAGARMVVFITDPDAVQLPAAERLVDLYGLTASQARVAREFGSGSSYKDIARSFNVSEATVATHVKEVYAKVKVNRQADLMRHIMALGKASV